MNCNNYYLLNALKSLNPINSDLFWYYLGSIKLPEPFWTATKLKLKMNDNPDAETVFEFEIGKSIVSTTAFLLTNYNILF